MIAMLLATLNTASADAVVSPTESIGVELQRVTPRLQRFLNAPHGALVTAVEPHSPADHADLEVGDVLLRIDETAIYAPAQVQAALSLSRGDEVELVLLRDGVVSTLEIEIPDEPWALFEDTEQSALVAAQEREIARLEARIAVLEDIIEDLEDEDE